MQSKRNPVHPQPKTRKNEGLEMELENCDKEHVYTNFCDLDLRRRKISKAKAAKNTQNQLILILVVLLIFLFLALVVFIGILFTYYKNMAEEQSRLMEIEENMAEELSRLRENDKNITEEQSRLRETDKNMAKEQSRLKETDKNIAQEQSRLKKTGMMSDLTRHRILLNQAAGMMSDLTRHRILLNEAAGSLFNKIQRNLGAVGKLLEEVWKRNSSAQPLCDKSWMHYGLSCYYKSKNEETFNSAKSECEKKRAHLVIINGEDEMNFLRGFSEKQYWWIGLRRVNGGWEWIDGTSYEMTPKFWGKGQPNNASMTGYTGGQDCVKFGNGTGWDDRHCVANYKYICENEIP